MKNTWVRQGVRNWAMACTTSAITCQAVFLAMMTAQPMKPPPRIHLFELIWAWLHEPMFYVLLITMSGAAVLTLLAWPVRGWHRATLIGAWGVVVIIGGYKWGPVLVAMVRVLWRQIS